MRDEREPYECAWCGARYQLPSGHKECPNSPGKARQRARENADAES
jgi:rubredoxin